MKNNIILIGFMGCGKSSIGIRLSYTLKKTIIDTDKWIEKKQNMSIPEIFEKRGEEAFRQMETECLRQLIPASDNQIIATGGGLPVREENHALLKQLGRVYYLRVTPEAVYERLKGDDTRPLLQVEEPMVRIRELLGRREASYRKCADAVIETSQRDFDEIISEIIEKEKEAK